MPEQDDGKISRSTQRYALGLITTVYVFNFIDRQILAILLPAIKSEFGVDDWVLGFLAGSAFALFYATLGVPIALLADRVNRRNLIAISLTIWSAMTALCGLATNVMQLAMARVGVGVGEAGYSPPAHSMIADYYPPEKRSTAMGVFTLGISLGIMIAYLGGGWIAQNVGWREAFYIVGVPGLLLAVIFRFTVSEPPRGYADGLTDTAKRYGVIDVARFLLRRKSFIHLSLGAGLSSFNAYAILSFFPSFLVRSHGMNLAEIGAFLGIIIGVSTGIGYVGGGYVADRVGAADRRRGLQVVVAAQLLGWIFVFPLYTIENTYWVLAVFFLPTVLTNVYLPTALAQTQNLVGLRMRSVASALMLFVLNIIGLGLGPQIAGILSDSLAPVHGVESLRYSLLIIGAVTGPWAAWHFHIAARHIDGDLARANQPD
ncbi:MAG: spinster family MFS transporter [Woeseiaceae bacterium]